jgi:nuclear transport factor 2 (NTF2) superfamily protein
MLNSAPSQFNPTQKVRIPENAWETRDPQRVGNAYPIDFAAGTG